MESDSIEGPAGKKDSKKKTEKDAKVMIDGREMTVEEMKKSMQGRPGSEFFKSGRDRGAVKVPPVSQTASPSLQSTAAQQTEGEEGNVGEGEEGQDGGSGQETVVEEKPESPGLPAGVSTKQANKWLKLLDAGWYPMQTKDKTKMYLMSPDSDSKTTSYPYVQEVFEWWVGHLTDVGKNAYEGKNKLTEDTGRSIAAGTTLLGYMTTKVSKEMPLVRNQLGKIGFMQQVLYDLGWLTFLKVSKAPGLLPDDLWRMTLNDDPLADQAQEVRELFSGSFDKALDNLLRGLHSAEEIAQLDHELNLESGRLMKSKQETASALRMARYYEERLRIAVSCMPASVMQEYLNRTIVVGLVDATERAELSAAKAQIGQGVPPPT